MKAKHDKGSLTPKHIETIIHHIQSLDHSIVDQRIVAQYHVIAAHAYMKDLRDWANAQRHLDMVSAISSENRYDDISAIRLRVLGEMHDMQGDNVLGLAEVKAALELADKSKSKQLKVHILSFAGLIQAITALDQKDAFYALKLVDTTEKYVDETNDYPCLAPFTLIDYLENKADTLITLKKYSDALNCLAETKYCNITKMRNKEYIRILQAECYIKQKRPEYEEALGILSQIVEDNSHIAYYMNYAAKLHKIIAASSYGNAPDVVDLGIKLRNLRK